jgi:hypothetical protein
MSTEWWQTTQYYTFGKDTAQPQGVFKEFVREPKSVDDATVDKWLDTYKVVYDILLAIGRHGGYSTTVNTAIYITSLIVLCNARVEDVFRCRRFDVTAMLQYKCIYEDSGDVFYIGENLKKNNKELVKQMLLTMEISQKKQTGLMDDVNNTQSIRVFSNFSYERKEENNVR